VSEHWILDDAASQAFTSPEEGERYLDRILDRCKDAGASIRRLLALLIFTMAAFELLNRAAVDKIVISFVELKDQTSVATFLPVAVAYFQYQVVRQMLYWRSLERTFSAVLAVVEPKVSENQLDSYLIPRVPLFSNRYPKGAIFENIFSLQQRTEGLFAVLGAFSLPAFQIYAFSQLITRGGGSISGSLTVSLVLAATLTAAYCTTIAILAVNVIHWRFYHTFIHSNSRTRRRLLAIRQRILRIGSE
jgi:hypothetical protein